MNKTISINPDLFKFAGDRKSRKKTPPKPKSAIKVREPAKEQRKLRKQHVLRFIREQQERNYRNLVKGDKNVSSQQTAPTQSTAFNSDFDESLKYLASLTENKTSAIKPSHNHSLKQYSHNVPPLNNIGLEPVIHTGSLDEHTMTNSVAILPPKQSHVPPPKWGCLKNGSLPTYRNWTNVTQKKPFSSEPVISTSNVPGIRDERKQEMRSTMSALSAPVHKTPPNRYLKQKRVVRRTYKVGRSSLQPKVGVLVSNRTVRNNLMNVAQGLKQTPIDDVKRYLVKKGFIRVGSSAPNDVLRKMYETAKMMCGEIENYNSENLLYNYIHDSTES